MSQLVPIPKELFVHELSLPLSWHEGQISSSIENTPKTRFLPSIGAAPNDNEEVTSQRTASNERLLKVRMDLELISCHNKKLNEKKVKKIK